MDIPNTLDSIPIDLLYNIFLRLPAKSIGRCRCVSKILASSLSSEDFKQLFFTKSLNRPRLLFACRRFSNNEWIFYSSPQPQNPYEKSSLVVTAELHTKFRGPHGPHPCQIAKPLIYVSGLCYMSEVCISSIKDEDRTLVDLICNPSTKQYVVLPKLKTEREPARFLGFDPIGKQFKVRIMNILGNYILTLGTGKKLMWRRIQCPLLSLYPYATGICINGILYYSTSSAIACFDVRSETFMRLIEVKSLLLYKLTNYKGKLCLISFRGIVDESGRNIKLEMCVLEDIEKPQWSKYVYTLPESEDFKYTFEFNVVGMTATNEIVLTRKSRLNQFYVYYFNPEKNTLQSVEIQGFEDRGEIHMFMFMDHVEDLHVNDAFTMQQG